MSAPPPPPPPRGGGLSLYANLLDPQGDSSATISSAPVRYNNAGAGGDSAGKKSLDSSLFIQPIRRPVAKQAKSKIGFPKAIPPSVGTAASAAPGKPAGAAATATAPAKTTLADWTAINDEDEWQYGASEKRQRGGRKKKRNKNNHAQAETDWDELYDPAKPTNVDEYLKSDERIREVQEWKQLLYRHRRKKSPSIDSEDEDRRPAMSNQFAPPASYSFVPPPPQSPPPAPSTPPNDTTGDDAYARRLAMSQGVPLPPQPPRSPSPPPPPPSTDSATISRAPVRYSKLEPADDQDSEGEDYDRPRALGLGAGADTEMKDDENEDEEKPRSNRPGQAGFAQRLMSKYGWAKGQGLGAEESGIINPLYVQVEKRRKKADADGGGWAEPANKAKILGGRRKDDGGESKFGTMSECIVLRGMLEGMENLQAEIADGLGQEIGEECGEKYGRVERLYIDVQDRQVFIKFTDQVSALRAVNELDGRIFNGNAIMPKFYDVEKFEAGVYK